MACRSCGGNKKAGATIMSSTALTNQQDKYESGDWFIAQYKGPGQMHNIGSLSGVLKNYNMTIYGRGRNGDYFLVHKDDLNHKNSLFVAVPEGQTKAVEKLLQLQPKSTARAEKTHSLEVLQEKVAELTTPVVEEKTEDEIKAEEAITEIQDIARLVVSEGKALKRSEAMTPKEFADAYGYTHYLQVVAKVKSGELLSYRDEHDKMFVYHMED
ncbi:MAG: hypothetical protein E6Q36_05300 [Chryseobacterium sp.]|nr:MAG: hypothetical protein E6Q36_05300 [Chryseobacterium sp.]